MRDFGRINMVAANRENREAERLTSSVPEAGRMDGLSRVQSYVAARRGDIPTIVINGRLRVPLKKWRAILSGDVPPNS